MYSFPFCVNWSLFHGKQHAASQAALLRRIVDRIRNSLELHVVLQTAVDEIAELLNIDHCIFFWHFDELDRIQVVCEHRAELAPSYIGNYSLSQLGAIASLIKQGELVLGTGHLSQPFGLHLITRLLARQAANPLTPEMTLLGRHASLLIPVEGQERSTGFIACLSSRPRHWSAAEVEFMQAIAQQLGIAICQAQLYERTQRQAQRERLVNQITSQTRQSLNLKSILKAAIAQLLEALAVDRCLVHLVEDPDQDDEPSAELTVGAQVEQSHTVFRRKHLFEVCREPFPPSIHDFDTDGPITRWVIQTRRQVVISDVHQDERIGPNNQEYQLAKIKSSLVIPAQADGKLQAILYLNQCSHIRYWSKDDQKLAQAVADQLAISIQQAHLYHQTRQQAQASAKQAKQLAEALQELQQTQAQLIQSEKMSSLGQMVAGVAHEINNPISFIYGNIPYVERYVQDLLHLVEGYQQCMSSQSSALKALEADIEYDFLVQDLPRVLKSMKAGAGRIREIILSLRAFARLDEASCKVVDIHDGLESTLAMLKNRIRADVAIAREYGQLPMVECFPALLNQVFINLLDNALEAVEHSTATPKTITISTETIDPGESEQPWVRIRFADNGCGIPRAVQPKVFDPFFTTKAVGQGCGLGLAISYQTIVHQHGGRLTFRSVPNRGTEFCIEIPVEQAVVSQSDRPMPNAGQMQQSNPAQVLPR